MATWYGTARTNYFKVKDLEALRSLAKKMGLEVIYEKDHYDRETGRVVPAEDNERFGLIEPAGEGWPSYYYDEEADEEEDDVDLVALVGELLEEGEVAIFQEVGAEKMRYLTGYSRAINSKGETLRVSIDDIYKMISKAGWGETTEVSY